MQNSYIIFMRIAYFIKSYNVLTQKLRKGLIMNSYFTKI